MNGRSRLALSPAVGLAGLAVVAFVYVALRRMGYPFDLEWMEGSIVEHVQRVLDGKPIYTSPSVEFVPYLYNPLYYYLSALVAKAMGNSTSTLRFVSFCCTLALFATLYDLVARETKSRLAGVLALGILAATFGLNGQWFDLARTDTLFMALLLVPPGAFVLPNESVAFSLAQPSSAWRSWPSRRRFHRLWPWRLERGPCVDFDVRSGSPCPPYCSPAEACSA